MRGFVAMAAVAWLSGCVATTPRRDFAVPAPSIYFVMAETAEGTCYFRYLNAYALDSVCTQGNDIRYSPTATAAQQARAIPPYVTALFEQRSVTDLLDARRAAQERMLSAPGTAPRSAHRSPD